MVLKRCTDVVLSSIVLLVLGPVSALIAAAVWLESGSPILFRQGRVGVGFQRFELLKFRSMRFAPGSSVTVAGDPRVTRVGRLLRITKLDEIPQFWNVLRGEMSIVGPRPEVPEYVELFRQRYGRVLTVRPGITDLASIRFRNEEDVLSRSRNPAATYVHTILPAKLSLAEEYIANRCFLVDLRIMVRTAIAVLCSDDHGN